MSVGVYSSIGLGVYIIMELYCLQNNKRKSPLVLTIHKFVSLISTSSYFSLIYNVMYNLTACVHCHNIIITIFVVTIVV